jgi:hypothetical protein
MEDLSGDAGLQKYYPFNRDSEEAHTPSVCLVISSGVHTQLVNDDTFYKEKKDTAFLIKLKSVVYGRINTTSFYQKTVNVK